MAKQARAHATRESIIQAAGVVFAGQSYSTATLAEVITEAGVTQGALYFHFDSKHDLAVALIRRQHELSYAGDNDDSERTTGLRALVLMSAALATQISSDPVIQGGLRLSTESSDLFPEYASQPYLDWIDGCRVHVDQAFADGEIDPALDAGAIARYIMSAFTGVQVVSRALTGWRDLFDRLEEMWAIIIPSLATPQRRQSLNELPALVRVPAIM